MPSTCKFVLLLALSSLSFHFCSATAEITDYEPISRLRTTEIPSKQTRIVNGMKSNPSNRPFFARAGYDEYFFTNEMLCGSTLIWSDILITAAHCQGAFNHGVLILDPRTNDYTRLVPIDRQVRHPEWVISRQQLNYDVLVMRLETPLASTDVAKPISIINGDNNYPSRQQPLRAYGFGLTENKVVSDHLREAEVTYISNDDCWGRGISFNNVMKSEEVMCTDPYEKDKTATCVGDSGGPLTDETGSTLVGVISFGSGCEADHIPDGHVRISEVHDWIQEQICLLSANPPDSCTTTTKPRDPHAVEVVIKFTHDFYPEQTTFAVKSKKTFKNVYAGPEYIPERSETHREPIFLLPGEYTFDVFDINGNGLESSMGDGSWKLLALYDGTTETEIASGGPNFKNQQVTKFVVEESKVQLDDNDTEDTAASEQLKKCENARDIELASGDMFSSTCKCENNETSDDIVLTCFHGSGELCAYKYQICTTSLDCCGGLDCNMGKCRSPTPTPISAARGRNRLGGPNVGGAAARRARLPGNLRKR